VKIVNAVLVIYFLILFPTIHLVFPSNRFIYEFWPFLYFALTLLLLLVTNHVTLQQLGFKKKIWKALTIGIMLGIIPIICVPLIDGLLVKSSLSQSELFIGAELRVPEEMRFNISLAGNIFTSIIVPILDQVFVLGLVANNFLKKQKTIQVIIGSSLLYSLIHFNPSLENLFLGMISAWLLRASGSIIVPILMHIGFAITETIIILHYPRLISILVFLV
jgi:membrane protease YdiL (CAAX protease family)